MLSANAEKAKLAGIDAIFWKTGNVSNPSCIYSIAICLKCQLQFQPFLEVMHIAQYLGGSFVELAHNHFPSRRTVVVYAPNFWSMSVPKVKAGGSFRRLLFISSACTQALCRQPGLPGEAPP